MYRVTKMSGTYYAMEINDDWYEDQDEIENIKEFSSSGTGVILIEDLDDLAYNFDIEVDEIQIVEKEY